MALGFKWFWNSPWLIDYLVFIKRSIMNNKENQKFIKKKIIEALKIDAKVDWNCADPNKEFKDLIIFVNKLFKKDYGQA